MEPTIQHVPTVDAVIEYMSARLGDIFGEVYRSNDLQDTLMRVEQTVANLQQAAYDNNADKAVEDDGNGNPQHRYAALDAAMRILPEMRDVESIIKKAAFIEKYLSGIVPEVDSLAIDKG